MTTDKKFCLLSYRADYHSHREDERIHSRLYFNDELTREQLEERIFQLKKEQDRDDDWYGKGWQFLITLNGLPLASRGEEFYRIERPTEELKPLAAELEDIFKRAEISSEEERATRKQRELDKQHAENVRYNEQQRLQAYQSALETIRTYEAQQPLRDAQKAVKP